VAEILINCFTCELSVEGSCEYVEKSRGQVTRGGSPRLGVGLTNPHRKELGMKFFKWRQRDSFGKYELRKMGRRLDVWNVKRCIGQVA
jgi:hypothetical protein